MKTKIKTKNEVFYCHCDNEQVAARRFINICQHAFTV